MADGFDPIAILRVLDERRVNFVLIGDMAEVANGSPLGFGDVEVTVQLKDDEHDLRQLRPVQDSVVVISDSGTHYVLSYDPLSVRYNGSSKYYESFGEKIWMSFDFAHPRIAGAPELQDLPIGHYTMRLVFSGVPSAPEAKIEFTLVKKDTKVNWAFK